MDLEHLPIIDWELALRVANHKKELAEEIHELIMKSLPQDVGVIKQFFSEENYEELLKYVHKLHGALCYCGLPRLKKVVKKLETELRNNNTSNLAILLHHLEVEVSLLLKKPSEISPGRSASNTCLSVF